jgi:predicted HicB family RNase H-like nuclease
MEYKGYNAVVTYDNDVGILHGEVIDTRDVITFQGRSVDDLQEALKRAVDDYLRFCEERGREPDKPFSGKVALRMDPETHRTIVGVARTSGKSLNTWILDAIGDALSRDDDELGAEAEFQWDVDQGAIEAFYEYLRQVTPRGSIQEPASAIIPMWVDLTQGVVLGADAHRTHEIFRFDALRPKGSPHPFNWV